MMNRAKQMYDYYVRPVLGEKGQDMVEYALMLAIIVGIGWLIYQQSGIQDSINQVFKDSSSLMTEASSK
ncbi:MAG: hypothetical protein SOY71_03575 [Dialister sp.]|nr:hypothetical protein [Dialister sp.]